MLFRIALAGLVISVALLPASAQQAPADANVAATMTRIGSLWQQAVRDGKWWQSDFFGGAFALDRFAQNDSVSYDVRKTDSLLTPFLGIVTIDGSVETNSTSPVADGAFDQYVNHRNICFKNAAEAWAHVNASDISPGNDGRPYHFEIYYRFDGDGATLTGGNEVYKNYTQNALLMGANAPSWGSLVHQPLH